MRRLKTIIIDDETPGRLNLQRMIEYYCPRLEVTGSFESAEKAKKYLEQSQADAVFLDICMPNANGFDFIHSFSEPPFSVVFITAYQEYAIQAIRTNAIDYLLKPILPDDLQRAESRLLKSVNVPASGSEDSSGEFSKKIVVYHSKGFNIVDFHKIIWLQADGNYTTFHFVHDRPLVVSRPIGEFESMLDPSCFVRVHKSHLINLEHFEQYIFEDAAYAILTGGHRVEISRRRATLLFERLSAFTDLRKNYKR
jgi:two-component system LytT family response regulator